MGDDKHDRVRKVIAETFRVPAENVPADAAMGSVAGWDSMGHMQLVVALEKEFG
ncbi:MAG: acyl carrier protein, partial [Polyangiaceae bacterium]